MDLFEIGDEIKWIGQFIRNHSECFQRAYDRL